MIGNSIIEPKPNKHHRGGFMKNNKKSIGKRMRTVGVLSLAFFVGWLLSIPIKSFAAADIAGVGTQINITSFVDSVMAGLALILFSIAFFMTLALIVVMWRLSGFYSPRIHQKFSVVVKKWGNKLPIERRHTLAISDSVQPTPTPVSDRTKERGVLKLHKQIDASYTRIQDTNTKAQKSTMSQKNKDYSNRLSGLADEVVDKLQAINDLGQLNAQEIIEKDGLKVYGEKTHKEKAEAKLLEIEMAMFVVMSDHATTISNGIKNIKLPASYEVENLLEEVRAEGNRLLSVAKDFSSSISTENEFVLKKIVETRLDELWDSYKQAKESYFKKEPHGLDLSRSNNNPDATIKEALVDIQKIFKDIDLSIKAEKESSAKENLLVNKIYFEQRKH